MSLYGIETKDDCRAKIDELLELHRRAKETMTKEAMVVLKSRLEELYKKYRGDHANRGQMSEVENAWFWPAIEKAYVTAPKLSSPKTWPHGLYLIELSLNDYRPADKAKAGSKSS